MRGIPVPGLYVSGFRPFGKMYRPMAHVAMRRALRMYERAFDRVLATEPDSPERASTLRGIEEKRTALACALGVC